ncbi:hypothetical protein MKX01_026994 [Papaver californicum]|nr:hypothetical protein MKX01_026994 [Papaver californicum]
MRKHRRPRFFHYKTPNSPLPNDSREGHEMYDNYLGAQTKINLWNPVVEVLGEINVSQIWVAAGDNDNINVIEAGWVVSYPSKLVHLHLNVDYHTGFFVLWTTDDYKNRCFNLECDGTSSNVAFGCNFTEMSTFNGDQKDGTFSFSVGYYPSSLFTRLSKTSTRIEFGREMFNERSKGRHSTTQIHVQVIDENNETKYPKDVKPIISNSNCYDLKINDEDINGYGFYYGGPVTMIIFNNNNIISYAS